MTKVVPAPNLHVKTVDDKVLVHDANHDKVHVLNASAGRILDLCDGTRDADDIARAFAIDRQIEEDLARRDVATILSEFARIGLVSQA